MTDTTDAEAVPSRRRWRPSIGIRGRLIGAFVVVGGLTLAACLVSYSSFVQIDTSFAKVEGESMPQMSGALDLSRQGGAIAALASAIASAGEAESIDQSKVAIAAEAEAMRETLGRLAGAGADAQAVESASAATREMMAVSERLWEAKNRQFTLGAERSVQVSRALAGQTSLTETIAPIADDAAFNLEIGLQMLAGSEDVFLLGRDIQKLIDNEIMQLNAISALRAEANTIIGLYAEVSMAPRSDALVALKDRLVAAGARIDRSTVQLPREMLSDALNRAIAELMTPARARRGIVEVRRDELQASAEANALVAETQASQARLAEAVSALGGAAAAGSAASVEHAENNLASARFYLIVLAAVSLLISAGIAWLYVSRSVLGRLSRIHQVISALAGGDLELQLSQRDRARRDELGEIARAVEVFRHNAAARLEAEREAAEQRSQTEAERRRNALLSNDTAEKQAAVVQALGEGLEKLAAGDLSYRIESEFAEDYRKLRDDFNNAIVSLHDVMGVINAAAGSMHESTGEISGSSDTFARRIEQQAASLEETAAALNEITSTVQRTAQGAVSARRTVDQAKTEAARSAEIVSRAVEAMNQIDKSSGQIGQIIGIIDEIAFQTNLLALNAGVEAARAGEAGRGFAVVAQEVRGLAQRSTEAAREIKGLISASVTQVGQGVQLVGETGQALQQIVDKVTEITATVADISSGAQDQATGLQQVNVAVAHMDQTTQQNAAMVEESTAASHELAREAAELVTLIGRFKINDTGARRFEPPAPRAALAARVERRVTGQTALAAIAVESDDDWQEF
jgi:methyl-accepting chemotaxis protein